MSDEFPSPKKIACEDRPLILPFRSARRRGLPFAMICCWTLALIALNFSAISTAHSAVTLTNFVDSEFESKADVTGETSGSELDDGMQSEASNNGTASAQEAEVSEADGSSNPVSDTVGDSGAGDSNSKSESNPEGQDSELSTTQQLEESQPPRRSLLPYRRVFVPQSQLSQFSGLEQNFTSVSLPVFSELLKRLSIDPSLENTTDVLDLGQPVELQSSIYSARLNVAARGNGGRIVSGRSLIVASRGSVTGERIELKPWNLSVSNVVQSSAVMASLTGEGTNSPPSFMSESLANALRITPYTQESPLTFDTQGNPIWNLQVVSAEQAVRKKYLQFGWILQNDAMETSPTGTLHFRGKIPLTGNSCLLLTLPPNTIIESASVPVSRVEDTSVLDKRLSQIPEEVRPSFERAPTDPIDQSLWILELTGVSEFSFRVQSLASDTGTPFAGTSNGTPYHHLILEQSNDYALEGDFMLSKSQIEMQWNSAINIRPLQMTVPEHTKVRRIHIVGSESEIRWGLQGNQLIIDGKSIDEAARRQGGAIVLNVELLHPKKSLIFKNANSDEESSSSTNASTSDGILTEASDSEETKRKPIPDISSDRLSLPAHYVADSFALRGKSTVDIGADYTFISTQVQGGSYGESSRSSVRSFIWRDKPCAISMQIAPSKKKQSLRSFTRLSGNGGRISTSVRILFPQPLESDIELKLHPAWKLSEGAGSGLRAIGEEPDGSIRYLLEAKASSSPTNLLNISVESKVPSSSSVLQLPNTGLIAIDGFAVQHFVILDSIPSRYQIRRIGSWSEIAAETLAIQERALLAVPDGGRILRSFDGYIGIDERETSSSSELKLFTTLTRQDDSLTVVHSIEHIPQNSASAIEFTIPTLQAPWRVLSANPSSSDRNATSETGSVVSDSDTQLFQLPLNTGAGASGSDIAKQESLRIEVTIPILSNTLSLPLPRFGIVTPPDAGENAVAKLPEVIHKIAVSDGISLIDDVPKNLTWSLSETGRVFGDRANYNSHLTVETYDPEVDSILQPTISQVSFDLVLDPNQVARIDWQVIFERMPSEDVLVSLDKSWMIDPTSVRSSVDDATLWGAPVAGKSNQIEIKSAQRSTALRQRDVPVLMNFTAYSPDLTKHLDGNKVPQHNFIEFLKSIVQKPIQAPKILINGNPHALQGRLWLPQNSPLGSLETTQFDKEEFWNKERGLRWWNRARDLLSGRSIFEPSLNQSSASLPEGLALSFPIGTWRFDSLKSISVDTVPGGKSSEGLEHNSMPFQPDVHWYLYDVRTIQWICYIIFAFVLLICIGFRSLSKPWLIAFYIALCLLLCSPLAFGPLGEMLVTSGLAGLTIGIPVSVILKAFEYRFKGQDRIQDGSTANWGSPNSVVKGSGNGRLTSLILIALIINGAASESLAQQNSSRNSADVIIPTDDLGNVSGQSVLIPNSLLSSLSGAPKSDFLIYSARHTLRINHRNRPTTTPDQCVLTYDVWVGQIQTITFPTGSGQGTSIKLSVDEIDIPQGTKFQLLNDSIAWIPDRLGRQTVQIRISPNWINDATQSTVTTRGERWLSQSADIGVLPSANALLEIDSADPNIQIAVNSLGGMTNPAPGRYIVSLGNLNKLELKSKVVLPTSLPNLPTSNAQASTLSLEFLFQGSHLRVMSFIHVVQSGAWSKRFTMEADDAWVPIGNRWKGVSLVETRPASLPQRRQYVFEVDAAELEKPRFDLPILWGLQPRPVSVLNILFLECIDHRVTPSIFRYGGLPGSDWLIESVRNWENAVGGKERFQWDDILLTDYSTIANPPVTSLKFPSSNVFGIIRKRDRQNNLSARVNARWSLLNNEQQLFVRMETVGSYNSDVMEFSLPNGFQIVEARHNSDFFTVNQSLPLGQEVANGQTGSSNAVELLNKVQLIAPKEVFSEHEITLRAVRYGPIDELIAPWIQFADVNVSDYTMEISADDQWLVSIRSADGTTRKVPGRGIQSSISSLSRTDAINVATRPLAEIKDVQWSIEKSNIGDRFELHITGRSHIPPDANSRFTVEFPSNRFTSWRVDRNATQISCPIQDFSWIQVDAGEATETARISEWQVTFQMTPEQLVALEHNSANIAILEQPEFMISNAELETWFLHNRRIESGAQDADPQAASMDGNGFGYNVSVFSANKQDRRKAVYWLSPTDSELHFKVPEFVYDLAVSINGRSFPYQMNDKMLVIKVPALASDLLHEIEIAYSQDTPIDVDKKPVSTFSTSPTIELVGESKFELVTGLEAFQRLSNYLTYADYFLPERMTDDSFAADWLINTHSSVAELESHLNLEQDNALSRMARQNFLIHRAIWPELGWEQVHSGAKPFIQTPIVDSVAAKQAMRHRLIYTAVTLIALLFMVVVGIRYFTSPALLLSVLTIPIWLITANWNFVAFVALAASLIFLDNLLLVRQGRRKSVQRFIR